MYFSYSKTAVSKFKNRCFYRLIPMVLDPENGGIIISFRLFHVHSYAFVFLTTTVCTFCKRRTMFFMLYFYDNIYLQNMFILLCMFFAMKAKKWPLRLVIR